MEFETRCGGIQIDIHHVIIAGWTGRDTDAVNRHIAELAELGITRPSRVPLFYRIAAPMLVQSTAIRVLGTQSSGEAEPVLLNSHGETWLGLASDHTDRQLEAYSIAHAKQICHKPVAGTLWKFSEVHDHIDELVLSSWISNDGEWQLYQQGNLNEILPLQQLLEESGLPDNAALLCGTLPAIGGVRPSKGFRMALHDPVLNRNIRSSYRIECLPIIA